MSKGECVAISTTYKRILLRKLAADATGQSISLGAYLLTIASARVTDTMVGRVLTGVTGNGHAVTFASPIPENQATPQELAEALGELLDLHDWAKAALGGTPTDAQIVTEMLDCLVPIYSVRNDYTGIRA